MNILRDPRSDLIHAEQQDCLIQALLSEEIRPQRRELGDTLCELHNAGSINLVSAQNLSAIEALVHEDFWRVVHPLNKAIPNLDCSYLEVLSLVQKLVKKAGSDGAAGIPNSSLVTWSKNNLTKAREIVNGVKELNDLCLAHGVFAVVGVGDESLAFDLIAQSDLSVVAVGLQALGRFETVSVGSIKRGVDSALDVIKFQTDRELRFAAIETAFRLWEKLVPSESYRQREFIRAIPTRADEAEISFLSAMLFYHERGLPKESIEEVIDILETLPSNSAATLNNLNNAIKENDDRWVFVKVARVFGTCIPRLDEKARKRDYYSFSNWVWGNPEYLSYLCAGWLSEGEFSLCSFLAELLGASDGPNEVWLQKLHLPPHVDDQIFMARKCIGFLWHREVTAASILLSIVKYGQSEAQSAVEKLLFDPLLLSYGGDLRVFLEKQCSNSSKRISECAKRLLSKHDAHILGLETTKDLVELLPSIEHRRAVAMKDRDRNRDIRKQAHEHSIFASLMTHQTLLYGRKSFSIIHSAEGKKHPNISTLSEFSHSVELPRLIVMDPVGFNAMITFFRAMKRKPAWKLSSRSI
ncbi:hypothetical protein RMR21_014835 [Agrobacterium sp. rho-8.1]|nr:hypothetical protein [Agrobacterium sp. rho-8.1]